VGKINVKVKEEIDKKFREEVFKRKGMRKGNITEAIEEAMLLWINTSPKGNNIIKEKVINTTK
jgi:hypothetical protein